MKIYLIIGKNIDLKNYVFEDDSLKIGIDKGSFIALENGIKLDYAVGDFDSSSEEEKSEILTHVPHVIELNPIKDDTDTKHAYSMWRDQENVAFVILGGIMGQRIEHFYANLELVMNDKRVSIEDDNSKIFMIDGEEHLFKDKYKYVSFFPIGEKGSLSLKGFAYELENEEIHKGQGLAISNEFKDDEATIKVNEGKFLTFLSKNDKV